MIFFFLNKNRYFSISCLLRIQKKNITTFNMHNKANIINHLKNIIGNMKIQSEKLKKLIFKLRALRKKIDFIENDVIFSRMKLFECKFRETIQKV